jgi:hypothetical protein
MKTVRLIARPLYLLVFLVATTAFTGAAASDTIYAWPGERASSGSGRVNI